MTNMQDYLTVLLVILTVGAIFIGIINAMLCMMLKAMWSEIKEVKERGSEGRDKLWAELRKHIRISDDRREHDLEGIRRQFDELKTWLTDKLQARG